MEGVERKTRANIRIIFMIAVAIAVFILTRYLMENVPNLFRNMVGIFMN